jgi:UTP--glucose-1-phosphate uridylyltransferase
MTDATGVVRTAVIPAAGLGTRFLPATKAVPKEMLPIVDRPAIEYVVAEAAAAGITDVVVVTAKGKDAIEAHFAPDPDLEAALERAGRADELAAVRRSSALADVRYVIQDQPLGLGHAVGVAAEAVGDRPFAVLLPDELHDPALLTRMLRIHGDEGASVVAVMEIDGPEISAYGVVDPEPVGEDLVRVRSIVEKPPAAEAVSNLASVGRYVFDPAIFSCLERIQPGAGGELQLTDAIEDLLATHTVLAAVVRTRRFDVGRKIDALRAVVELTLERDDLAPEFREILSEVVRRHGIT